MLFHVKCGTRTLLAEVELLARLFPNALVEEHESANVAGGKYFILRTRRYLLRVYPEDEPGFNEYRFELSVLPKNSDCQTLTEAEEFHLALLLRSNHMRVVRILKTTQRCVEIVVYRKRAGAIVAIRENLRR